MSLHTSLLSALLLSPSLALAVAATVTHQPQNTSNIARDCKDPFIRLCMSEFSPHCYVEPVLEDVCRKVKNPKTYGDKGSYFSIRACPDWQCELFERNDCTRRTDQGFPDIAVYSTGGLVWNRNWWFASYKCSKS